MRNSASDYAAAATQALSRSVAGPVRPVREPMPRAAVHGARARPDWLREALQPFRPDPAARKG
jgi:hypothetical protein